MLSTTSAHYERALRELSASLAQAEALASLLDYFAGQLRGRRPDPEGPPLELYPAAWQVHRVLQQRDAALDAALDEWDELPTEAQEGRPSPEDVLEGAESSRG